MTEAAPDPGIRFRRTLHRRRDHRIVNQIESVDGWRAATTADYTAYGGIMSPAFTSDFELARYDLLGLEDGAAVLPLCPISFRDFMLSEEHAIDAARGMVKRFRPAGYRLARLYEATTGRTFPPLRPSQLWYRQPIYYMSNALTIVPSGIPITTPPYSRALDFELELGVVIGVPLHNATVDEASAAISAAVVINDFSARDVQLAEMHSGFGPQRSKHFLTSMSATAVAGPAIADDLDDLTATVTVNGKIVSRTGTQALRYSMAEAIAHVSRGEQLYPGELFCSGTLPGGSGMELDRWLAPGDHLQLAIDGIGVIDHHIRQQEGK